MVDIYEQLSKERKEQQALGKYPEWFTTGGYQMFKEKYEYEADGYNEQIERISSHLSRFAPKFLKKSHPLYQTIVDNYGDNWKDCFYNLYNKGDAVPSSPLLANCGTDRGSTVSCSGGVTQNSVKGFYDSYKENALLTKEAFGTSTYLGDIQGRGTLTSKGFKATGTKPVLDAHFQMARDVSQGQVRRGSIACYLEIDHIDFDEWADALHKNPQGKNIGWIITKKFISLLNDNDEEAHRRFSKALWAKMLTGKGYFWKVDHVNEQQPQMYKDLGLSNKASNLCVAPDTFILTDKGHIQIGDLENEVVNVWNGEQFSETTVVKTSESSNLFRVGLSSGQSLDCTEHHKFYVQNEYGKDSKLIPYNELKIGDKLIKSKFPVIEGSKFLTNSYQNGFYSGDGCEVKGKSRVYFYGEKKSLEGHFDLEQRTDQPEQDRVYGNCPNLQPKFFVPTSEYDIDSRLSWLAGLLDSDGSVARNGTNESLQVASINKPFLLEVQLMLQTLGVNSKVCFTRGEGEYLLPANDGTGNLKNYNCSEVNRLLISSTGLYQLSKLGLKCERLKWEVRKPQRCAEQFSKVLFLQDLEIKSPTYCFKEELRGMGVFNGILTGQCSEIVLHADEDHTYTCILMSMNCYNFERWEKSGGVFVATVLLDCLVSDFLDRAKNILGLEKAVRFTEKSRALGLGLYAWHSYLQSKMIGLEEYQAHSENMRVFSHMRDESLLASQWLASKLGEPEWCKGYGVRHTHRLAIAPNMSSAVLGGQFSQGIEPWLANVFSQPTAAGEMQRINPELIKLIESKGKSLTKALIKDIVDHKGSVQHLSWLNEQEKLVFKTAFEIDQKVILRLASTRQQFIDQGQSLNLFFSSEEDEAYIAEVHKEFLLDDRLKGLYYIRSESGVMAAKDECIACEA